MAVRVTGRIQIGRFVFTIGAPEGTRADPAVGTGGVDPGALSVALREPVPTELIGTAGQALTEAESVTSRVERALELFMACAQGRVDRGLAVREANALIDTLERLDQEGRHADAFRLAHALAGSLALLMRWVALVQSLRIALRAAIALGNKAGEAWARHELGTFSMAAEDAQGATRELQEARKIRHKLADDAGEELSEHNLVLAQSAFGTTSGWSKPMIAAAVIGGVLLLGAIGAGIAIAIGGGDDGPAVDTVAPTVSFDETPDDPTEERSASFEFAADEDVERFECSLDGDSFGECSSPRNISGPLGFGEHAFSVRAVDLAGNRGEAETFRWTIERGEGPTVTITKGPESLVNETTAVFEFSGADAVRFQCEVDGGGLDRCSSPFTTLVDEGDHVFVVRGIDANGTAGAQATHEWTVDTHAPTVEIDRAERTNDPRAEVEFTPSESEVDVVCVLFASDDPETPVEEKENCTSPVEFEGLDAASSYVVRITATDAAGNVGETAEEEIPTFAEP